MFRAFSSFVRAHWLNVLVGLALTLALLYVEEDTRGAHAWAAIKAEWEAKGESFDRAKFVPPPVPDEQNLAMLPLFKLESVARPSGNTYLELTALHKAMREGPHGHELPYTGGWSKGELPDVAAIRKAIATGFTTTFKDVQPPTSTLAQFNALYPFVADIVSASAIHPHFRLPLDYLIEPPVARSMGPVTDQIKVSKLVALHAVLALRENQPNVALEDLKLNQELFVGIERDPSLIGHLVSVGIRATSNAPVYDGLTNHAWSDAQLAEIEGMLAPINLLADYQHAMRSETITSLGTIENWQRETKVSRLNRSESLEVDGARSLGTLFPGGWWDNNKRQITSLNFHLLAAADPHAQRVFPKVALDLKLETERVVKNEWYATAPWNFFFSVFSGPMSLIIDKFAQGQVSVDETRIACALERYHLAHGDYPATLAELAPACIDEVPHDIMNGEPYHYRLNADGTFLLYSVGWNQTDEGGTVAFKTSDAKTIDYEKGDWVWPTAKVAR